MKILYITGSMPPLRCGVGFYTNRLLDFMPEGFDLLTTSGLNTHERAARTHYVSDWKLRRLPQLLMTCRRGKYDIIHIQYPTKGYQRNLGINFLPYLLRLFAKPRLVMTLHEYHGSGTLGKTRDFISALPVHEIILSNPYDMHALPWILRRKARIIPIGSNIPVAKPNPKAFGRILKKAGLSPGRPIALFFGFPYLNKGVHIAIEAAAKSDMQLLLLTSLDEKDDYQKGLSEQIETARGQGAQIYVAGFLQDKEFSEIMQECDYFLLPQSLPLTAKSSTAITAASHGLVVISTAGGNPALSLPYVSGVNSMLVSPMNASNLLRAIELAPKKADIGDELAKLRQHFNWQNIQRLHEELYQEVTK